MHKQSQGLAAAAVLIAALCSCTEKDADVVNRKDNATDTFKYKPAPPPPNAEAAPAGESPAPRQESNAEFQYEPDPKYFPEETPKGSD